MNGINIPRDMDHYLWWENIGKKTVQAQLSSLRNDRLKECKWSYYGKKNVFLKYYISVLLTYLFICNKALLKKLQIDYIHKHLKPDLPEKRLNDFNPGFILKHMRDDFEIYSTFYKTFIPCIVGKRFFGTTMKNLKIDTMKETDLCTYSDEALALLAFENGYDLWIDVWKKSKGTIRHVKRFENIPEEFTSDKGTKYTTQYNDDGTMNNYYRFWSNEGINRFNVLRGKVRSNRKECPEFFEKFVGEWRNMNFSEQEMELYNPVPEAQNDYTDITVASNAAEELAANQIGTCEDDDSEGKKYNIEGKRLDMDEV